MKTPAPRRPLLQFARLLALVFAAGLVVRLALSQLELNYPNWVHALLDAAVLSLLVAPFFWQWLGRHEKNQRATEQALQKSELKFRRLFEDSADAQLLLDLKSGRFIDCNPAAAAMLGFATNEELLNLRPADLSPRLQPDGQTSEAKAPLMIARAVEAGSHRFEWVHCSAHRSDFPVEVLLTPIQLEGQQLLMTTWRDITERKEAEAARRRSEEQFAALIHSVDGIVWEADAETFRFTFVSPRAERLLGYPTARWIDEPAFWVDHIHPDDREHASGYCRQCTREKRDHEFEYRMLAADGRAVWLRDIVTVVVENGRAVKLRGIMVDITARQAAEAQIREQADLLNQTRDAIMVAGLDNRFTFWNEGAERITGWTAAEALGQTAEELFRIADTAAIAAARQTVMATGAWHGELPLHHRDGRPLVLNLRINLVRDDAGRPSGRISIGTDITAKARLEEQLLRVQRLETLGTLAAGIAHDLNNILSPVLMAGPLLRTRATHPSDLRVLDLVERSAERGSALVKQILSFARGVNAERVLLQARHILLDVCQMIADTFPKSILVESHIPGDLWPVVSNSTQLHQVVLNLCINARDAMPTGGTLTLSARNETLVDAPAGLPSGNYLLIEVADTGTGMSPEVLARIWEPFFTTKAEGQGTGLGLATVRGILAQHGGTITVESAPGRGSVFRVYLPATMSAVATPPTSGSHDSAVNSLRNELVLVVDDDTEVRKLMALSLAQWGYRILQAKDSAEAMETYLSHSADIALIIFDLDLPGQDGLTLARQLQGLRPDLRVLFVTGVDSMKSFLLPPLPAGAPLLKKPFARQSLRTETERALAAPAFVL